MNRPTPFHTAPLIARKIIRLSFLRRGFSLALFALAVACFALSPTARGVTPPPDGGYPNQNTAEGDGSLNSLTTGDLNTAVGFQALRDNTAGRANTAIGVNALSSNSGTVGNFNTAIGSYALNYNVGSDNIAVGSSALYSNTTGEGNVAVGSSAMIGNQTGNYNIALGYLALRYNSGDYNIANGPYALASNTTGNNNVGAGYQALYSNTTGANNTANGVNALLRNTGANNTAIGYLAGQNLTTGGNNIDIGANVTGNAGEATTIRIGKSGTQQRAFIAGISGKTVASGVGVIINSNGQLGTVQSSARFKDDIKPMDSASEAIMALKPVTFRYKEELDPDKVPQFGLIAEDVEKVNPDLVVRDEEGKVNTVRYEAVNAMLLNEFLKEHRKVQEQEQRLQKQEATIVRQQKDFELKFAQQQKEIAALTATVRKVSDQISLSKRAPQLVTNP